MTIDNFGSKARLDKDYFEYYRKPFKIDLCLRFLHVSYETNNDIYAYLIMSF